MPYKDKDKQRKYFREYWLKNIDIKKSKGKQYWLRSKYNLSIEEYNNLLDKFNYRCALCKRHASEFKGGLAIDHCHETNVIRGVLCMPCNTSLGQLGDTPKSIANVLNYLTQNTGV